MKLFFISLIIAILSVLITSAIKMTIKKVTTKKLKDIKKLELFYTSLSFGISFVGVLLIQYYYGKQSIEISTESAIKISMWTPAIYIFVCQSIRKGGKFTIMKLYNLYMKIKGKPLKAIETVTEFFEDETDAEPVIPENAQEQIACAIDFIAKLTKGDTNTNKLYIEQYIKHLESK